MRPSRSLAPLALLAAGLLGFRAFRQQDIPRAPRFEVPPGFVVETVYDASHSGSVVSIAFDAQGRLVVARERGPVVTLLDPEGDGTWEARVFTDSINNAQGLAFEGRDLLAVGEGREGAGLYRVVDADGDARGDRVETIALATGGMQEHGPHAVFHGPDGYLYWTLGNHVGLRPTTAPLSPYRDFVEGTLVLLQTGPRGHAESLRAPGGGFYRIDRRRADAEWEHVAGGFRNQYDGAFNLDGELFTFDSDMEWDLNLPWYRPVRSVHVVPGGEYGWRTGARKWPAHFPDNLPPMSDVGRGSPTGVVFYQHHAFPASYRDAFLQADWSRGRILVGRLKRSGATYTQELEDFVRGTPLNVTDVEVGPDGAVYFSLGGRDTEGGVYRVVYRGPDATRPAAPRSRLEEALTLPQPRCAWARERAGAIRAEMGERGWGRGLAAVARDARQPAERRARALELMQVHGPAPDPRLLVALSSDPSPGVRAAATYHLGLHPMDGARTELARRLRDTDPPVRRRAAEALVRTGIHPAARVPFSPVDQLLPLLGDPDRWVRFAARLALQRVNRNQWREAALRADGYPLATEALLALVSTSTSPFEVPTLLQRELELLRARPAERELTDLVRVIQLTLLQDRGVRHARAYDEIGKLLLARFPSRDAALDRELARTLAYLRTPGTVARIAAELRDPAGDREQQIFYAYALSALPNGWEEAQRTAMVDWFARTRAEQWKGGASFIGYLEAAWNQFLGHLPEPQRRLAMERVPSLSPLSQPGAPATPAFRRANYAQTLSEQEIEEYLLFDPMNYRGDARKGAAAYDKAFCSSCHRFGGMGQEFGPDLTTVGSRFRRADLLQAILYPSRTISDLWAAEEVTRRDGRKLVGTVAREDAESRTLAILGGARVTIPRADIASRRRSAVSPMPEGLLNNLSDSEMRDLLLFPEAGVAALPDSLRADN